MRKRLEILLTDQEMADIRVLASRNGISDKEWARQTLHLSCSEVSMIDGETKLNVIDRAAKYNFPTTDIDQMLSEIDQSYLSDLPAIF